MFHRVGSQWSVAWVINLPSSHPSPTRVLQYAHISGQLHTILASLIPSDHDCTMQTQSMVNATHDRWCHSRHTGHTKLTAGGVWRWYMNLTTSTYGASKRCSLPIQVINAVFRQKHHATQWVYAPWCTTSQLMVHALLVKTWHSDKIPDSTLVRSFLVGKAGCTFVPTHSHGHKYVMECMHIHMPQKEEHLIRGTWDISS